MRATQRELGDVEQLCRLAAVARRLGCGIHLVDADAELRELIEIAGVADVLLTCPALEATASHHRSVDLR